MIIWQGASQIDGSPVVAIATGVKRGSKNAKTGEMVQVWIIRADMNPLEASRTGADRAVCGDCPHRGEATTRDSGVAAKRSCYVNLMHAPSAIYRAFRAGSYPTVTLAEFGRMVAGRPLRIGAYGDPAAVPFHVWDAICPHAAFVNGYTHQWRNFPELAQWCMASVDSAAERVAAGILGFRSFRVRSASEDKMPGEVICPASEEAGKRTECASCRACGGHSARAKADIVIIAHATAAKHFEDRKRAA